MGFVNERDNNLSGDFSVGRNQKPNRKERKQISFRVSETEYLKLKQSAKTLNMSVPSFVKKKAQGSRLVAPKFKPEDTQMITQQLNYIGNNINQMAKALNTSAERTNLEKVQHNLEITRKELNRLWQLLK